MGALTAVTKWIPEDDLLLKNAVEAGASLESLSRGAVCFSRRFTLRELQDRWYSLLYDSDTSAEASARIIEFEIELLTSNSSKANRTCNSKGKEFSSRKRKGDSIRNHYYAMRKRICNKPFISADFGTFVLPCSNGSMSGECGYQDPLKHYNQQPVGDATITGSILNCYGHMENGYNNSGQPILPEFLRADSSSVNGDNAIFHPDHVGSVKEERDCLYGYTDSIAHNTVDTVGGNNGEEQSLDHNYVKKDPEICGENHVSLKISSGMEETKQLQLLPTSNSYDNEVMEEMTLPSSDSNGGRNDSFLLDNNIVSRVPECDTSLEHLGCSSPTSGLPIWNTIEDIAAPTMPVEMHIKENEQKVFGHNDTRTGNVVEFDITSQTKLNDGISDGVNNAAIISENDFIDFSSSYMDFATDDELLFIDVDEKDIADTSCLNGLSSIFLNSPNDSNQDDVANSNDPKMNEVLEACLPEHACSEETNTGCDQIHSSYENDQKINVLGADMTSSSSKTYHSGETLEAFVICTMNTEDPEVPSNDDIVLPARVPPQFCTPWEHSSKNQTCSVVSSITFLSAEKSTLGDLTEVKEEHTTNARPVLTSMKADSSMLQQKVGYMHAGDGCTVGAESSEGGSVAGVLRNAVDVPNSCSSAIVSLHSAHVGPFKEEYGAQDPGKHDNFDKSGYLLLGKPGSGPDSASYYSLNKTDGCKEETGTQITVQKDFPSHASTDMILLDAVTTMSTSDQEQLSDSENDVPNFSDIEAMILEMDLGPYDQESRLISKEVLRYQCVDSKKAIIRLEQGAQSYINRVILSHGAFAVLYGRHMKYFMKDPEVTLGRETEDVKVDIDLGREGHANKISRRQAIIKMDQDGSFLIKNIGKCSIFVNSKEVPAKKRINLSSGSLIEIRDMQFIFEVNQNAVRHYFTTLRRSSQHQSTTFDWPAQNT
ncbi:uncharacterized protein [Typha angustifolia]|uniref:uncharacterized protein n=1 Tax=Typha angustifolia TaxID=59011 RepID=UPI003C2EE6FB